MHSENLKKESWIANKTIDKVKKYIDKGDQVLFFLNRRGYAPFVICKKCGYKFQCPNCSVNLNFHKKLIDSFVIIVVINLYYQDYVMIKKNVFFNFVVLVLKESFMN